MVSSEGRTLQTVGKNIEIDVQSPGKDQDADHSLHQRVIENNPSQPLSRGHLDGGFVVSHCQQPE